MKKIETKLKLERLNETTSRVVVEVRVDGENCGVVVVAAGPPDDCFAYFNDEILLEELRKRWMAELKVQRKR